MTIHKCSFCAQRKLIFFAYISRRVSNGFGENIFPTLVARSQNGHLDFANGHFAVQKGNPDVHFDFWTLLRRRGQLQGLEMILRLRSCLYFAEVNLKNFRIF